MREQLTLYPLGSGGHGGCRPKAKRSDLAVIAEILLEDVGLSPYAPGVDPKDLLRELLCTCRSLGLGIRDEPMKVPATRLAGGLVRLRGTAVVILDSSAPIPDRIAAVADALCELAVDPLHLSKEARHTIHLARLRRRRQRKILRMRRPEVTSPWKVSRLLRRVPRPPQCPRTE